MPKVTRYICDKCMVEGIAPVITIQLDGISDSYVHLDINDVTKLSMKVLEEGWTFCSKTCATAWLLEKLGLNDDREGQAATSSGTLLDAVGAAHKAYEEAAALAWEVYMATTAPARKAYAEAVAKDSL